MKIGDNIREIREVERNYKRSYVAERLNITLRAYANIENNITDITLQRLEQIADILECSPLYILNYKQSKREFYNYFHNNEGNQGINIMHQGQHGTNDDRLEKLQQELLESERKRITLLEALLKQNNVNY